MADENKANKEHDEKADAGGGEMLDKILKGVDSACNAMDSLSKRMDAMEGRQDSFEENMKEKKDVDEDEEEKDEPKRVAADKKAKKDSDEDDKKEDKKADAEDDKKEDKKDADDKEEKKEEAKSDSVALMAEINALKARMTPRSDDDYRKLIGAQAKYDSIYAAFGDSAPRFLDGESLSGYRRRVTTDLQKHSPAWKNVDLALLKSDDAFDIAEGQIMSDSMGVALNPTDIPAGILREIKTRDKTGREISTFYGRSRDWMTPFSGSTRRAKINPRPHNSILN